MEYTYFRIDPSDLHLTKIAKKYKDLRLAALKESPGSFSSTYAIESGFSEEVWKSRISTPGKETFICATTPTSGFEESEWVAQVTLLGPIPAAAYALAEEASQPAILPDNEEEKWQMLSLYTLPAHRGKGLGKKLCQETFNYLTSLKRLPRSVRVRIMVKPENTLTLGLYKSLYFVDAGLCTLEEALRANGDAEYIPQNELSEKYTKRTGRIMVLVLQRPETV